MKERIMYVIQRADGKFYWKHPKIGSYYGYDSFDKAHLFITQKGAKLRLGYGSDGQECNVKQVKVTLDEEESNDESKEENRTMKSKFEELWEACENRMEEFRKSHKEQSCRECGELIRPGDTIWCEPLTDKIYCSAACYAHNHYAVCLDFEEDGYESWFDTKEESR